MIYTLEDSVIYLDGERIGHGNSETLDHLQTITGTCDKPTCPKCSSTDLIVRWVQKGQHITSSAGGKSASPFVHSSEYDLYWKWTACEDHMKITCNTCKCGWRKAIKEEQSNE